MAKSFSINLKVVGGRISRARKKLRITQECIAERTELTGQYWSLIETGRCRGSISAYLQIASALGLTLNDLFYDDTANIRIQPPPGYADMLAGLSEYEKEVLLKTIESLRETLVGAREFI